MKEKYKGYYIDKNNQKHEFYGDRYHSHLEIILDLLGLEHGSYNELHCYVYELMELKGVKFILLDTSFIPYLGCVAYVKEDRMNIGHDNISELEKYNLCEIVKLISQDHYEMISIDELKEMNKER